MTRSLILEMLIVDHIGIDIGSRESQVCVRNGAGEVIDEVRCRTSELGPLLAGREKSRVIVETCTEAFRIADAALAEGHEVRVVPATLVRSLGVGRRGLKNDQRDARILSEASSRIDLPSVHIPSATSREWKALSTSREALVKARTQLISTVRCYVRSRRSSAIRATPESLPPKVRAPAVDVCARRRPCDCRTVRRGDRQGGSIPERRIRGGPIAAMHLPPPDGEDVEAVLHRALRQVIRDWENLDAAWAEDEYEGLQQRAIQEKLSLSEAPVPNFRRRRVAVAQGFSLHADTAVHGNDRQGLERLARYGARGPIAECRLRRTSDGRYEYTPKKGVAFTLTAEALVRRLLALLPPARLHLTSFHGVYAPHAALRPLVTRPLADKAQPSTAARRKAKTKRKTKRRLDWATLHQRTFGTDVLTCPCGGRRTIRALHSTRKQAEERLADLGISLPPWRLPPATAPPQLNLAV